MLMFGDAHLLMCQWTASVFIQVMSCHLTGIKPLPKPMLIYYHIEPQIEQILVQFTPKHRDFLPRICTWYNVSHFVRARMCQYSIEWYLYQWQPNSLTDINVMTNHLFRQKYAWPDDLDICFAILCMKAWIWWYSFRKNRRQKHPSQSSFMLI